MTGYLASIVARSRAAPAAPPRAAAPPADPFDAEAQAEPVDSFGPGGADGAGAVATDSVGDGTAAGGDIPLGAEAGHFGSGAEFPGRARPLAADNDTPARSVQSWAPGSDALDGYPPAASPQADRPAPGVGPEPRAAAPIDPTRPARRDPIGAPSTPTPDMAEAIAAARAPLPPVVAEVTDRAARIVGEAADLPGPVGDLPPAMQLLPSHLGSDAGLHATPAPAVPQISIGRITVHVTVAERPPPPPAKSAQRRIAPPQLPVQAPLRLRLGIGQM
jgi:hypothetical protein